MHNITLRNGAIRCQIHDSIFDGNSRPKVCSISHYLREISKTNKLPKVWPWNESQAQGGKERDLLHSTGNIRFHVSDFCQNFSYLGTNVYAILHFHTFHTSHTHTPPKQTHTHTGIWLKEKSTMYYRFA